MKEVQGGPKKERHFKYIHKIANNSYNFMKLLCYLTTIFVAKCQKMKFVA